MTVTVIVNSTVCWDVTSYTRNLTPDLLRSSVIEKHVWNSSGTWGECIWDCREQLAQKRCFLCVKLHSGTYRTVPSLPYRILPYRTAEYRTLPYRTAAYRTLPYPTIPYRTVRYRTVPYRTVPHRTVPYRTLPYRTVKYRTAPYRTVPVGGSRHF